MIDPYTGAPFRYSFSGADCRAHAFYPDIPDHVKAKLKENKDRRYNAIESAQNALMSERSDLRHQDKEFTANVEITESGEKFSKSINLNSSYAAAISRINIELERLAKAKDRLFGHSLKSGRFGNDSTETIELESLGTISISIHEPKGVARALGHRSPKGFARSVRTIAGSMIMTVVEGHPLEELMLIDPYSVGDIDEAFPIRSNWSYDQKEDIGSWKQATGSPYIKPATTISPFYLFLEYVSEYDIKKWKAHQRNGREEVHHAVGAQLMLKNVEFVNEGIVTSVNDMVTEVVYQFVATGCHEFSRLHVTSLEEAMNVALDPGSTITQERRQLQVAKVRAADKFASEVATTNKLRRNQVAVIVEGEVE